MRQVSKNSVGSGIRESAAKSRKQLEKKASLDSKIAEEIEAVKKLIKKQGI